MIRRSLLPAMAILLSAMPAVGREVVVCQSWPHHPTDVTNDGGIQALVAGWGWVTVRPRGVEGPRPDGACSIERFLAVLAQTKIMLALQGAQLVAFCAPRDVDTVEVEATVLIDGVDLQRVLAEVALAQPTDGAARLDWCAR